MKIIRDSHEKIPWDLTFFDIQHEVQTLKTGDYIIPDLLVIERKRHTGELAINLGSKSKNFRAELERMQTYKYRCIICEFGLDELHSFPINSGIPKKLWNNIRISANFLSSRLISWTEEFDIELYLCNNREEAQHKAAEIIREVYEKEKII